MYLYQWFIYDRIYILTGVAIDVSLHFLLMARLAFRNLTLQVCQVLTEFNVKLHVDKEKGKVSLMLTYV